MTVRFEDQDMCFRGRSELTRPAARERLAELCDSARHVCSVRGPFQTLGSLHPPPRVILESDLAVGRSEGMEL
jgi:hypothetical protein